MIKPEGSLISYFSNRAKKHGGVNLAQGIPGFHPPKELLSFLRELSTREDIHQYAPGIGNFQLLDNLRDKHAPTAPHLTQDNLLVVQGATEGIFLSFFYLKSILDQPFSALSFDPVYESYPELAQMFGIPFEYMDLEPDLSVDFDKLEKIVREKKVKVVFVASPGNPLGKVWNESEITSLIDLSQRYGFYIVFDAVYKDMVFGEQAFNPLGLDYERLFYVDSFSKMLSITGWRIGYMITPKAHMAKIRGMHDYTGLCAPSLLQKAISDYLRNHDSGKSYTNDVKIKCKKSFDFLRDKLLQLGFDVPNIQGGYFIWARLPEKYPDAFHFAMSLYDKVQLTVVPGENFSKTKHNYIRINIATPLKTIKDAAERLSAFFA